MSRTFRVAASVALMLGAAVFVAPPASAISDYCNYDSGTKVASVFFPVPPNQSRTVSRAPGGTAIQYNAADCGAATVRNTKRIDVFGFEGAQNLTIDLSNGPFAPGVGHETSGLSEIEWKVDLGDGTDSITVMGSSGADDISFPSVTTAKLNGDADTDIALSNTENRTVFGGNGDDHISAGASVPRVSFYGEAGSDTLTGGAGYDDLEGGADNDTIKGGDGSDGLYGGTGVDHLDGGDGGDSFYGGSGNDVATGDAGNDTFYAESGANDGADRFAGGPGLNDEISYYYRTARVVVDLNGKADSGAHGEHDLVGKDVEVVEGGSANDLLTGNGGDNTLYGDNGNDTLYGGSGNDSLFGFANDDKLYGGDGTDNLYGGLGNDTESGDAGDDGIYADNVVDGSDTMSGGTGFDSVSYAGRSATVFIRIGGINEGGAGETDSIGNDIEYGYGGSGADTLVGNAKDNWLYGNSGIDTIDGGAGSDVVSGGPGNDDLTGGDGADYVYGNDDNDTMHLVDGGTDYTDCGNGVDVASDRDAVDTQLTGCETT